MNCYFYFSWFFTVFKIKQCKQNPRSKFSCVISNNGSRGVFRNVNKVRRSCFKWKFYATTLPKAIYFYLRIQYKLKESAYFYFQGKPTQKELMWAVFLFWAASMLTNKNIHFPDFTRYYIQYQRWSAFGKMNSWKP